jgi:hypothetical protein
MFKLLEISNESELNLPEKKLLSLFYSFDYNLNRIFIIWLKINKNLKLWVLKDMSNVSTLNFITYGLFAFLYSICSF